MNEFELNERVWERLRELFEQLSQKYSSFSNSLNALDKIRQTGDIQALINFLRLSIETLDAEYRSLENRVQLLEAKLEETSSKAIEPVEEGEEQKPEREVDYKTEYEECKRVLEELQEKLETYKAAYNRYQQLAKAYQMVKSDYEAYMERVERNFEKMTREAKERIITKLIPLMDNFEFAIKSMKSSESGTDIKAVIEGVEMIYSQLLEILQDEGLEVIDAQNKRFDAKLHEAVEVVDTTEYPDETVIEQIRRGYKLMDKVIRPAMVKVSRLPKTGDSEPSGELNEREDHKELNENREELIADKESEISKDE